MAQNFDLEQTGPELQEILNQVMPNREAIGNESEVRGAADEGLQGQIDEIVVGGTQISLSAQPTTVFVGVATPISLSATTSTDAQEIAISKGASKIAEGSGVQLSGVDVLTASGDGNTQYLAKFIIKGIERTATRNVTAVRPIYYGAGMDYTAATTEASIRTSPAGTYHVHIATNGSYVWFEIPNNMTINKATMSGFDFPLQPADTSLKAGYKVYRSSNTYDAGTLTIVIS